MTTNDTMLVTEEMTETYAASHHAVHAQDSVASTVHSQGIDLNRGEVLVAQK